MKRLAGLALLLGLAWGTAWGNQKLEDIIGAMREAETGVSDIRVEFRNEMRLRATGDRQVITGDLAMIKKPQRFLVRYSSPVEQLAAYDGTALMLYFPATGQAVRQKATMDELTRMIGVNPVAPTDFFGKGRKARLISCGKKACILEVSEEREGGEEEDSGKDKAPAATWRLKIDVESWLLEEEAGSQTIRPLLL